MTSRLAQVGKKVFMEVFDLLKVFGLGIIYVIVAYNILYIASILFDATVKILNK